MLFQWSRSAREPWRGMGPFEFLGLSRLIEKLLRAEVEAKSLYLLSTAAVRAPESEHDLARLLSVSENASLLMFPASGEDDATAHPRLIRRPCDPISGPRLRGRGKGHESGLTWAVGGIWCCLPWWGASLYLVTSYSNPPHNRQ